MVFCNSPYLLVRDVSKNVMRTVSKGKEEKVETLLNICATLRKATHLPSSIFFCPGIKEKNIILRQFGNFLLALPTI